MRQELFSRRQFLARSTGGIAAYSTMASGGISFSVRPSRADEPTQRMPRGKAESCIFIWLGGGACHIDTWDPKERGDGKKKAGSYYDAIPTAIPDVSVCQHLSRVAPLLDRGVIIRSLSHNVFDEHAAATNMLHTGRATSGTVIYPSIGSIVAHELPPRGDGVPAYGVMGYPNVTRGPGFLGAKYGYVYLTETDVGPNGLVRPPENRRRPPIAPRGVAGENSRRVPRSASQGRDCAELRGRQCRGVPPRGTAVHERLRPEK